MSSPGSMTRMFEKSSSDVAECPLSSRRDAFQRTISISATQWLHRTLQFMLCVLCILYIGYTFLQGYQRCWKSSVRKPLRFNEEGIFQISVFEDLHFDAWEQWGPAQDVETLEVMNTVLDAESPQLAVLNGDLITGENSFRHNSTHYVDMMVAPLLQRSIPWASTYGNHDSDFNLSRKDILARERLHPLARTAQMVFGRNAGVSNYYLPVYSHNDSTVPLILLWFFDSRGGSYFQESDESGRGIVQPNWVDRSVVEWFRETHHQLTERYEQVLPSIAFVHIPTNASRAFQTDVGPRPHYEPGINDDYPLAQQSQGWCADGSRNQSCSYGGHDIRFMEAITSTPGLMGLFSGHDHGDSWCYKWDSQLPGMDTTGNGINLCFGQHTGYGGYGDWIRGSRQILIAEEMLQHHEIDTWIRLEDGSVAGSVTLNSSYGHDRYKRMPDKHTHCSSCRSD